MSGPGAARSVARGLPWSRPGSATGSATVWLLVVVAVLWTGTVGALALGSAVVARHRAAATADLAALAGARALLDGDRDPCGVAARVAAASGARLAECRPGVAELQVVAEVAVGTVVRLPPARARARAGGSDGGVGSGGSGGSSEGAPADGQRFWR